VNGNYSNFHTGRDVEYLIPLIVGERESSISISTKEKYEPSAAQLLLTKRPNKEKNKKF